MHSSYLLAFVIDCICICLSSIVVSASSKLRMWHPFVVYLVFHTWTVTIRLCVLMLGAPTSTFFSKDMVTEEEIFRTSLMFDLSLVFLTLGWFAGAKLRFSGEYLYRPLSRNLIKIIVAVMLPFALLGLANLVLNPYAGRGYRKTESDVGALQVMEVWPIALLLIDIYANGFRRIPTVMTVVLMGFLSQLGTSRYMVILSALFLLFTYLERNGKDWPSLRWAFLCVLLGILWLPAKDVAREYHENRDLRRIPAVFYEKWATALAEGDEADTQFLDDTAVIVDLQDSHGQMHKGVPWLGLLLMPIPRQLWPGKPEQNRYVLDLDTERRTPGKMLMVPTLMGDAYLNFGYIGICVVSFLVAFFCIRVHLTAERSPFLSVEQFTSIAISMILLQVYRDGVGSLIVFLCYRYTPFLAVITGHYMFVAPKNN